MNIVSTILKKCSVMQWGIGFTHGNIEEVIRNKKLDFNIQSRL